ncbi:MAG: NADPH-dependent FMN reductase [Cyanobacteria bacterium P01_A01_bin.3]
MATDLYIPVILGTVRQGRMSEPVAQFVFEQVKQMPGIDTQLVDIRALPIPVDDAGPQAQIPEFADVARRADGYIIVTPEYNHGYPGLLKHVLDLNYQEYVHKAVGVCSVSVGAFGGVRAVESLLSSFKAFGLSPTVADFNITDVNDVVDENGQFMASDAHLQRFEQFMRQLVWLATTLKYGRDHFEYE